jgi:hypothetical protein
MNLPYPEDGSFVIYEGAPVAFDSICAETIIGCTLHICMLKCVTCEWLALLFDAKGLLSKKVRLDVVLEASSDPNGKPNVVGYPVAVNVKPLLDSFCKTFMLCNMWSKTENMASCVVSVETEDGWIEVFTLEELLNDKVAWHAWNLV